MVRNFSNSVLAVFLLRKTVLAHDRNCINTNKVFCCCCCSSVTFQVFLLFPMPSQPESAHPHNSPRLGSLSLLSPSPVHCIHLFHTNLLIHPTPPITGHIKTLFWDCVLILWFSIYGHLSTFPLQA